MSGEAVTILEDEVRELVRRRGLDPVTDRARVVDLLDDALADYDERAVRGAVPRLPDPAVAHRRVLDAVAGLGALQPYLDDDEVEEIWINSPSQVFVARRGEAELTTTILTEDGVRELVERMLRTSGRRLDVSSPFVDASLPGGERLHAVIPDVTRRHWSVNIRKHVVRARALDDLVALGTVPVPVAAFLAASVRAGLNVLVSGGTQAGKTTLLNALAGAVPQRERIISCEEVFELRLDARDWVALQTRSANLEGEGEIPLRRLVKEALRMRPDRLVVGEVREAEALDLLIALNAGLPAMCTLHANSAREALVKLCTLPLLAGENVSDRFVVPTVASAVDLVVHVERDARGRRRVREVLGVPGRVEAGVVETAELFTTRDGVLVRGEGFPPHADRYARTGTDVAALLRARW
ncbi:CpaF family protein [Cellulomonas marina]|uniref:Pilus assembly protein CpaF n=1 Tax=Cellulomonas marina TaxID=988821 RepID=A0A1I0V276_9CELL|nr:ATPase, T2SS/T4P/T4SS family [Cellulomonas marina]GIG28261.1 pilus assembly protein CpaF [Cellulomonas marina]SFA70127.1 pilus assembly protein CpaF [Cellulomonas marina]